MCSSLGAYRQRPWLAVRQMGPHTSRQEEEVYISLDNSRRWLTGMYLAFLRIHLHAQYQLETVLALVTTHHSQLIISVTLFVLLKWNACQCNLTDKMSST